jgi:putative ABC transport system permease protein
MLLARRPGVALALSAAALVAALPAAAAPLFLSSSEHATLHRQIDETCQWRVGAQFTGPASPVVAYSFRRVPDARSVVGAERYRQREAALASQPVAGLTAPVSTGYGEVNVALVDRPLPAPDLRGLTLLAREGFQDEVEVLAGPAGDGLWLPHEYAEQQGIEVGDELELTRRSADPGFWAVRDDGQPVEAAGEPATLPVAATYRDLRNAPPTPRQHRSGSQASPYWCGSEYAYAGTPADQSNPDAVILPTALVDTGTLLAVGEQTQLPMDQIVELAVADPRLTAPEAARLAADVEELRARMFADHPELFTSEWGDDTTFVSYLDRYERRAGLVRSGLLPPVLPITAAGTLVGLAVAGAAAVFWVQRRRRELTVLAAHGVSAGGLGVKAVTEALPAVAAGSVAGWAAAWALVAAVGPSPVLAGGTLPQAAAAAAVVGLVGLGLIGGLAAAGARGLADVRPVAHGRRWWVRVPWELGLLATAPLAWVWLAADQVVDEEAGGVGSVAHVPARLLVAPILLIAGLAILAARVVARTLARRGLSRTPRRPAGLLAWRRSVRVAATTTVLAAATAVPVAMAAYGATATDSIRETTDAQLRFNLGSDTVVVYDRPIDRELDNLPPPPPVPGTMAGRATEVARLNQQQLGGLIVDVLAVDPDTFTDGAFWDGRISGASLADAVDRLAAGGMPTVVASRRIPAGPSTLTVRGEDIPVEVAATRPLPGAQPAYPMVIIHRDALAAQLSERALSSLQPQVWIAGDPRQTRTQITDAELPAARVATIDDQRAGAIYEPVTYTFQYLIALSVFTGLIGAVGLLLYLESRTTAHRRAYVMLRRLGLRPGAHRRALLLEVGAPMLAGLVTGLAAAVGIAYLLAAGFDLDPRRFPATLVEPPVGMAAVVAAAAVAIAVGASLLAHARIARANPAEVLRDTS